MASYPALLTLLAVLALGGCASGGAGSWLDGAYARHERQEKVRKTADYLYESLKRFENERRRGERPEGYPVPESDDAFRV